MKTLRKSNRISRRIRRMKPGISSQEIRVIELLSCGLTHKEIANKLFCATSTVSKHVQNASRKYKVNKETALVSKHLKQKHGIIDF